MLQLRTVCCTKPFNNATQPCNMQHTSMANTQAFYHAAAMAPQLSKQQCGHASHAPTCRRQTEQSWAMTFRELGLAWLQRNEKRVGGSRMNGAQSWFRGWRRNGMSLSENSYFAKVCQSRVFKAQIILARLECPEKSIVRFVAPRSLSLCYAMPHTCTCINTDTSIRILEAEIGCHCNNSGSAIAKAQRPVDMS